MPDQPDVTRLLSEMAASGGAGAERLMPVVYDELRRLAASHLRRQRPGQTLQATALVHEAYLRLVDQTRVEWQSRAHFFAVAALAIRRIVIDQARARGSLKRGGNQARRGLDAALEISADPPAVDLLALDEALDGFSREHPEKARVVELRYFGGLTVGETAEALGVTTRTVERYWEFARAWLFRALGASGDTPPGGEA
ncbi:MAG: sigma-70 family RNA polymerase sigma factor [Phycisphaerae bacterium]